MEAHKIIHLSQTNEWYTPARYIEAVRAVMGQIDIDPASCEIANKVVRASVFYDTSRNGLLYEWPGKVFLNPPYGKSKNRSNQDIWSAYLLQQYQVGVTTEAVLLVNAATDRRWFQRLWAYPVCFTNHRIKFYNPSGTPKQPTNGNAFVYLGKQTARFMEVFSQFGVITALAKTAA